MIRIRDSIKLPGKVRATWWLLVLQVLGLLASLKVGQHLVFFAGGVIPSHFFAPETLAEWFNENASFFSQSPFLLECLQQHDSGDGLMRCIRAPAILSLFWAMFLHQGWLHLITNGLALAVFGPNVEAYMGRTRFLLFYFSCGVFGFFVQALFSMDSTMPIIGASGAISGLFGAYMALFGSHHIRITLGNIYRPGSFYRDISIPIKALLVFWIIAQVFSELMGMFARIIPGMTVSNVAFLTHIGGFICGFFLARGKGSGFGRYKFKTYHGGANKPRGPFND